MTATQCKSPSRFVKLRKCRCETMGTGVDTSRALAAPIAMHAVTQALLGGMPPSSVSGWAPRWGGSPMSSSSTSMRGGRRSRPVDYSGAGRLERRTVAREFEGAVGVDVGVDVVGRSAPVSLHIDPKGARVVACRGCASVGTGSVSRSSCLSGFQCREERPYNGATAPGRAVDRLIKFSISAAFPGLLRSVLVGDAHVWRRLTSRPTEYRWAVLHPKTATLVARPPATHP